MSFLLMIFAAGVICFACTTPESRREGREKLAPKVRWLWWPAAAIWGVLIWGYIAG